MWNWIALLEPSQATVFGAIVSSVLGFATLTLGALFNAHLNRRRDDRLADLETLNLLRAITSEMLLIRNLICYQIKEYKQNAIPEKEWFASVCARSFVNIYSANIALLLNLPSEAIQRVSLFYHGLDEYEYNLTAAGAQFVGLGNNPKWSFKFPIASLDKVTEHAVTRINSSDTTLNSLIKLIEEFEERLHVEKSKWVFLDLNAALAGG